MQFVNRLGEYQTQGSQQPFMHNMTGQNEEEICNTYANVYLKRKFI